MYIYILIGGLVLLIILYFILTWNKFISLNNDAQEAFGTMDVYLKKRIDLIPNLVEVVKGYAKHEKVTIESIASIRTNAYEDLSLSDKLKTNQEANSSIAKLLALVEDYPELKASENFLSLSESLSSIEDEIAKSRKYYNAVIRIYNNKVEKFPSNIVAKICGFKTKEMFKAKDIERESVTVQL